MRPSRFLAVVLVLFAALSALPPAAVAGWQQLGDITSVQQLANGLDVRSGQVLLRLEAVTDSVVRVRLAPAGTLPENFSWAVLPEALQSPPSVRHLQDEKSVGFATSQLQVRVERSPFRLVFLDAQGKVFQEDAPGLPIAWGDSGFMVYKSMPIDEHYYGMGEKGGPLDKREQAYVMWNTDAFGWQESTDPLYKTIPFFLVMRAGVAHGVYLDNTYRSNFDFGKRLRGVYSFGAEGGALDYYVIYGPHPKQVVEHFAALTGRMPLPPKWSLGYQQCRYSYEPESEVRRIANEFRQRQIPADVIYLDIDYQRGNRPFTVDTDKFPTFDNMIADLHRQGFHVIAITDLHLKQEEGYPPYDQGMAQDLFVKNPDGSVYVGPVWPGPSVFPDFTLQAARDWWGTLYKDFYLDRGIDGFWNDMNEPAVFETPTKTMPLDVRHRVDGRVTDHREIHNVLGMQNARATYYGLWRLKPEQRPFVLTRAAFAGAWRYAATWTGDNSSTWNHLRMTVPSLVNLGLSGYAMVGNDVGGFAGSPSPDLLTRWIQVGVFTPIYRDHTTKGTKPQEPWVHGPEHEAIRKRYIELRYRFLPYIYTVAEETARTGLPMMRPLFLEYPQEEDLYTNDSQFLFGRDLLIAPKLDDGTMPYDVQFPAGGWYDYWTGRKIDETKLAIDPPLDLMPIYARAGAIIPQQPVVQNTTEVPEGPLELRVYPGPDCSGSLYDDDGKSFAYRQGEYLRLNFTCEAADSGVTVQLSAPQGTYKPWWNQIEVTVFGIPRQPSEVTVDGTAAQGRFDSESGAVSLTLEPWQQAKRIEVYYSPSYE